MKAWILHGINDIRLEETLIPELKDDEVLVRVKAAGICGSDIPRIYDTGAHKMPLVPGHEFSGVVEAAGKKADRKWQGKKVGIFPLIPCGKCSCCRNRQYELCRSYDYLGSRRNGGFAEFAAVPEWNLIELPEEISFEAAAMLEPMAVAVHAIRRLPGDREATVTVFGLGTIGLFITAFLKDMGYNRVLSIGNKELQRKNAALMGLWEDEYCDSRREDPVDWIMKKTEGRGTALFFECVGKEAAFKTGLKCTAPEGGIVTVGNPASDLGLEREIYWRILRNQLTVKGTWNSSFCHDKSDDWSCVTERLKEGRIRPERIISHKIGFEELEKGLLLMRDKKEEYVKIMISMEGNRV